ncbi:MAG: hypothetical protein ACFFB3_06370 [Candidatus Hodarchaeota archaeon]
MTFHISHPVSVWAAQGLTPPDWLFQIKESLKKAEDFTRALFKFHRDFSKRLAQSLDIKDVKTRLINAGFQNVAEQILADGAVVIQAEK